MDDYKEATDVKLDKYVPNAQAIENDMHYVIWNQAVTMRDLQKELWEAQREIQRLKDIAAQLLAENEELKTKKTTRKKVEKKTEK